jgi:hypothetical protein
MRNAYKILVRKPGATYAQMGEKQIVETACDWIQMTTQDRIQWGFLLKCFVFDKIKEVPDQLRNCHPFKKDTASCN